MNSDTVLIFWLSEHCVMDGYDMLGEEREMITKAWGKMALNLYLGPAWVTAVQNFPTENVNVKSRSCLSSLGMYGIFSLLVSCGLTTSDHS